MRRAIALLALALSVALVSGCSGGGAGNEQPPAPGNPAPAPAKTVYFGWLLGTTRVAAVAFDVDPPGADGTRTLRAYVCDGLGQPDGLAVWFSGPVNPAATTTGGQTVDLTSVGGRETLSIDHFSDRAVGGAFTDATGRRVAFVAYPGFNGAGIYQVTLDQNLHYSGTSTDGSTLSADSDTQGRTRGTITTAAGQKIDFVVQSLALTPLADLAARGLPADFPQFAANNQVPGEYVAVIAPGGTHWLVLQP
jgi:hypothetical protein